MAPPRKRRRLAAPFDSPGEMSLFEPIPAFTHSMNDLEYPPTAPKRIDEVQLHEQKRAVTFKAGEFAALVRRQTAYPITTVDAAGNTIISTITVGLNAGAATSTGPTATTPSPAAATPSPTHSKDSTTTAKQTQNPSHRSAATSNGRVSPAATSTNATQSKNGPKPTAKSVYLATLSNGKVKTITRSSKPYLTTFGDGEVSTICDQSGQCRISGKSTATNPNQSSGTAVGAGGGSQSSAAAANNDGSNSSQNDSNGGGGTPLSTIAGAVVGALAGVALILILILLFLRWYKRRLQQRHQALARDSASTPDADPQYSAAQSSMAERAGLTPLVGAMPTLFRHQNKSLEDSPSSERGFSKVSGRKLPSAFSDGVAQRDMHDEPPPHMPLTAAASSEKNLHDTSFYRDSTGFYGGSGSDDAASPDELPRNNSDPDPSALTLSPGPQRRPTIHEPGPYVLGPSSSAPSTPQQHVRSPSVTQGPGMGLSPFALERSATPTTTDGRDTPSTMGDNRSSRFTEDF